MIVGVIGVIILIWFIVLEQPPSEPSGGVMREGLENTSISYLAINLSDVTTNYSIYSFGGDGFQGKADQSVLWITFQMIACDSYHLNTSYLNVSEEYLKVSECYNARKSMPPVITQSIYKFSDNKKARLHLQETLQRGLDKEKQSFFEIPFKFGNESYGLKDNYSYCILFRKDNIFESICIESLGRGIDKPDYVVEYARIAIEKF